MDRNTLLNQMLYRMEEVFWHELSACALKVTIYATPEKIGAVSDWAQA